MTYFYTDDARRVLAVAQRHAASFQHDAVGIEHLALALIEYGRGPVEETFFALNVTPSEAWAHWEPLARKGTAARPYEEPAHRLPYTHGAGRALGRIFEQRRRLRHSYIGSEHLLLAVLTQLDDPWAEPEPATEFFERLGVDLRQLRQELLARIPTDADPPSTNPAGSARPLGISPYRDWLAGD